jgi:hypothetical protein
MGYLAEIDDISDELTMLKRALINQAYVTNKVLEDLDNSDGLSTSTNVSSYSSHPHLEVFERLSDDAHRVRHCVCPLFPLHRLRETDRLDHHLVGSQAEGSDHRRSSFLIPAIDRTIHLHRSDSHFCMRSPFLKSAPANCTTGTLVVRDVSPRTPYRWI